MSKRSLKELLAMSIEQAEQAELGDDAEQITDRENGTDPMGEEEVPDQAKPGLCTECGDQPEQLLCLDCQEPFCQVCFDYIHRTGRRREHKIEFAEPALEIIQQGEAEDAIDIPEQKPAGLETAAFDENTNELEIDEDSGAAALNKIKIDASFIPMRLTMEERKLLRLLEAALSVSEYVDKVDVYMYASKAKRIVRELREICTVLTGLVVANGMDIGKVLVDGGDFASHAEWYQSVFEVGRRYKIMNPERMRSSYGKLMYMIMDSRLPEIKQVLEFDLYKPVLTVAKYLASQNAEALLDEPLILLATMEIRPEIRKSRRDIQQQIRKKERAIESLTRKYGESVRQALYSIGDYHAYLEANRTPVDEMIARLKSDFDPLQPEPHFGLSISRGKGGARLTHDHKRQYQYVLQSLTLWSEIMGDMYLLWKLVDDDLLNDEHRYRLEDTGQGLNRVKSSPAVSRVMHRIIARAQKNTGSWVGSSVVHLGDRAVPNSLFFLDKYLQVPRILNPVNTVIRLLPQVVKADEATLDWVAAQFGSIQMLEKTILADFFRYAFDGSGADNFYDAGSCIDGRLTSAWNWTNLLPKKPYYKHFLITGFVGFDGTEGF